MSHILEGKIKDVYQENMADELRKISELVEKYPYIAMDTEFPGIVYPLNPNSQFSTKNFEKIQNKDKTKNENNPTSIETNSNYKNIKNNVDNLKVIQVGITLSDENGQFPDDYSTWQFNFKFDLNRDTYLHESINLLEMAGIDFKSFYDYGIDVDNFGELFTTSGLILNENVKWITFHGSYDFAYLVKVLSNQNLPEEESPFNELISLYFPTFYDVRHLIKNATWIKGSLSRIANDLDIRIIGNCHQAGSDSLVTSKVFFKFLNDFGEQVDLINDKNKLFGFSYKIIEDFEYNYHIPVGAIPGLNNLTNVNNISNISSYIGINGQSPPIQNLPTNSAHMAAIPSNVTHIPGLGTKNHSNINSTTSKNSNNSNMQNIMFYQNMNNNFIGYNGGNNIPNFPLIYNNSNINNYSNMYPQYEYQNYFGNYYPNNGVNSNSKPLNNASNSSKEIRFNNINQN